MMTDSTLHATLNAALNRNLQKRIAAAYLDSSLFVSAATELFTTIISFNQPATGKNITEVIPELIGLEQHLQQTLQNNGQPFILHRISRRLNTPQTTTYFDIEISAHRDGGFLITVEDATQFGMLEQTLVQERNELRLIRHKLDQTNQELKRVDRLKSLFLSMAAHDLRSPVAIINGMAELLEIATHTGEDSSQFIAVLQTQTASLDNLITNIIDLDQIEQGALSIERTTIDLNVIVAITAEALSQLAKLNKQLITIECPETPSLILGDAQRIQQVLQNLIENAIKYSPMLNEIKVRVSQQANKIILEVADQGYGMKEAHLDHIFSLYYRTDSATEGNIKGTGLGLFIVKTLVEAHEGKISVQSKPKEGTTFKATFPRAM